MTRFERIYTIIAILALIVQLIDVSMQMRQLQPLNNETVAEVEKN